MLRRLGSNVRVAMLALAGASTFALAARSADNFDPMSQVGANPVLPEPQEYLFPPMHLAKVVGWKHGEAPTVAPGLKIEALAQDLQHPRSIYVLPNGDILVVESKSPNVQPIQRPKDIVMGIIESWVTSGGNTGQSNRITLLRDENGDGKPESRSVLLDHLASPFGVALVGSDLYVANTDAIVRYPYTPGETKITAPGTTLTPLPGGPIDHHWTKSLVANADGSLLYVGVGSNSNITENGMEAEANRAAIWEVDRATGRWRIFASGLRNPNGLTFEPETKALWTVVNERDELGPDLVPELHDLGEGRRLLRLALQLLRPTCRSPRTASTARSRGKGHSARLRAELSTSPRWGSPSTPATVCRRNIAAERSSESTAAGTARSSMATRSSSCPSAEAIPTASRRKS